jgi:hypothetical protein
MKKLFQIILLALLMGCTCGLNDISNEKDEDKTGEIHSRLVSDKVQV